MECDGDQVVIATNGPNNLWSQMLARGTLRLPAAVDFQRRTGHPRRAAALLFLRTVSVEPFHLFRYLDEEVFRFNNRKDNDAGRFESRSNVVGKRVTYKALIGASLSEPETC